MRALALATTAVTVLALLPAGLACGGDVVARAPSKLAVTVYRAPGRTAGALELSNLQGFALVTETRLVHLPAGLSRLRFEGVANGIDPRSAIVSGLPSRLIEKNQDARLLDPSALARAAVGKPLELVRTNRKTGVSTRTAVTLASASEDGVVFRTATGVEAWTCAGIPETFAFASAEGLSAAPTLSVLVNSPRPFTAQVTLAYLARDFDWFAQYTAELSTDATQLNLGAWVTLANGNDVGFASADAKVVAGRVNRATGEVEPVDVAPPVLARCWPQETTSNVSDPADGLRQTLESSRAAADGAMLMRSMAFAAPAPMALSAPMAQKVVQEQLGDLKLYSIPGRTAFAARQSKQVRLMDRAAIPVSVVYSFDLYARSFHDANVSVPAVRLLRTRNTAANHLGLDLPSGRIAVFERVLGEPSLISESSMRDLAVDEAVEIGAGSSADVRMHVIAESTEMSAHARGALHKLRAAVTNARQAAVEVEFKLSLDGVEEIVDADHTYGKKDGRPLFKFSVPGGGTETVRLTLKSL